MPRAASVRAATIRSRSALVTPATFTSRTATSGESRSQPKYPIASAPAAANARSARVRQEPIGIKEPIEIAGSRIGSRRSVEKRGVRREGPAGARRLPVVATGRAPVRAPARLLPAAVAAAGLTPAWL